MCSQGRKALTSFSLESTRVITGYKGLKVCQILMGSISSLIGFTGSKGLPLMFSLWPETVIRFSLGLQAFPRFPPEPTTFNRVWLWLKVFYRFSLQPKDFLRFLLDPNAFSMFSLWTKTFCRFSLGLKAFLQLTRVSNTFCKDSFTP